MRNLINAVLIFLFSFVIAINSFKVNAYVLDKNWENINETFYQSVNYNPTNNLLSFTIPKTIPEGYRFYLHVSGRIYMGDKSNAMSFHAFDKESLNFSWEGGKTYTYSLNSKSLIECLLVFGLVDRNKQEFLYEIRISPDGAKIIKKND